jgi:hypothetical protein
MRKSTLALAAVFFLSMFAGSVYAEKKHTHKYKHGVCTKKGCGAVSFLVGESEEA